MAITMKNLMILLTIPLLFSINDAEAQKKIKEKDLIGPWKLIINFEEGFDEARKELEEDEDSFISKLVLGSVEGFVTSILDEVDIFMDFQKNGQLKIIVEAFDEKEVEYSHWQINDRGELIIDDSDNTDVDHWVIEDDLLVGYDEDGKKNFAYMVKII